MGNIRSVVDVHEYPMQEYLANYELASRLVANSCRSILSESRIYWIKRFHRFYKSYNLKILKILIQTKKVITFDAYTTGTFPQIDLKYYLLSPEGSGKQSAENAIAGVAVCVNGTVLKKIKVQLSL